MNALALAVALWCAPPPPNPHPPLSDITMFPDTETIQIALTANRQHIRWLEAMCDFDRVNQAMYTEWLWEANRRKTAWEMLLRAHLAAPYVATQRDWLNDLRDALGPDYHLGLMPAPVPIERFREIRP